jgi:hypothetical protein
MKRNDSPSLTIPFWSRKQTPLKETLQGLVADHPQVLSFYDHFWLLHIEDITCVSVSHKNSFEKQASLNFYALKNCKSWRATLHFWDDIYIYDIYI